MDGTTGESVILEVANTGTIPPELLDHLFDPFRGSKRPSGRGEGLGLGLYIVSQIVRAHRGSIEVESGNRTLFRVTLPRTIDRTPTA